MACWPAYYTDCRDLSLAGDLEVSVFPWLGVKTQGLSLSQPEGIDGDMVSVDTAQLRVKLAPLLSKKVEVDTVILEKPAIKLVTLKSGLDSFSGLSGDAQADNQEEALKEAEEDSGITAISFEIQGVELTDGTVVIDNRQEGSLLEVTNLNLITGNLIGSSLADIKVTGKLKDSSSPDLTSFDLNTKALINTDTFDVQMSELLAKVQQGEFDIEVGLESMSFEQLSQVEATGLNVALKGDQAVQASMPKLVANLGSQTASVDSLSVDYENVKVVVSELKVTEIIDQPSATGKLSVPAFDARDLVKRLEIDFQASDPEVLKSVGLSAGFAGSLDGALINDLVVNLDDTALTGSASVVNFEKPKIKFDLNLTDINLDSYLPETVEGEGGESQEVSGGEALAVPMAVFKDIDANGTFAASKLVSGGVTVTDIDVVVESTPGNVSITPSGKLYEGQFGGAIVFNESNGQSSLKVKNEIDLVQLLPLLKDAADSDQLQGIGTLLVDLLVTEANGIQSNQGTIELRATEGLISGIDVYDIVGKVNSFMSLRNDITGRGQAATDGEDVQGDQSDTTEFAELLGTFNVKDFLMTNDDFKLSGPGFQLTGAGQFDLKAENMDYQVSMEILQGITSLAGNEVEKSLGSDIQKLVGIKIPVRCQGAFEAPVCRPDYKSLLSSVVSKQLNDKKSELLKDKLGIETEDGKKVRTKDVFKQLLLKEVAPEEDDQASSESQNVSVSC